MTSTVFVNGSTLTDDDWFNDLNRLHYTIFSDAADLAAVKAILHAAPGAIGGTTPAAGTFTTLTAAGGSASSPSIVFTGDVTSGLHRGTAQVNIDISGVSVAFASVTGFSVGAGSSVAVRSVTEPTNALNVYNGVAPSGTLANGATFYCSSGEMRVMDAAGNSTLLSPHDKDGYWIFESHSGETGKMFTVHMERMMRKLDAMFGGGFIDDR